MKASSAAFIGLLTLGAFFSSFFSLFGIPAVFLLFRLPAWSGLWWLVWILMFIKWRATVSAVENNRIHRIAPPYIIILDLLSNAVLLGLAVWQLIVWIRS